MTKEAKERNEPKEEGVIRPIPNPKTEEERRINFIIAIETKKSASWSPEAKKLLVDELEDVATRVSLDENGWRTINTFDALYEAEESLMASDDPNKRKKGNNIFRYINQKLASLAEGKPVRSLQVSKEVFSEFMFISANGKTTTGMAHMINPVDHLAGITNARKTERAPGSNRFNSFLGSDSEEKGVPIHQKKYIL